MTYVPKDNPSIAPAMAAKRELVALGWTAKGSARSEDHHHFATLIATRGTELLAMHWNDGELIQQDYSLWNTASMADNNRPAQKLPFDPMLIEDRDLARTLSGSKLTWWNKLGGFEMNGIVDREKIRIEHMFNGSGVESPADRVITFIDTTGGGFRSLRLSSLLKVG